MTNDMTNQSETIRHMRLAEPGKVASGRGGTAGRLFPPDNTSRDMQGRITDCESIKGWGIDADPKNDPTYPIKDRNNAEHKGSTWDRPPQQPVDVEVLHSIERPNVSAVFGESEPPSGISGMLRRKAFRHSESSHAHWFTLVLADRVNVMEGYLDDLAHGHFPNVLAERGWGAEWQHDPARVMRKVAAGVVIGAGVVVLACRSRNRRRFG